MTTYYDHRAERTVAQADAEARRAEAEALRANTALQVERERRRLQREDDLAARQDKALNKAATAQRWKDRRAAARNGAGTLATAIKSRSHSIAAAAAIGSPMFIAWGGQLAFGEDVMKLGAASATLPIAMEGSVLYTAYMTHQAIDKQLPAGRYRLMTWVMAGNAAGMNLWHQVAKAATATDPWAGLQAGAIYAASSLLGIVLWELNAALKRQVASERTGAEIRRAAWRRLRYPRLSWAAASIRAAQACTVDEAWTAAWIDRYGIGPDAPRGDRRLARKVVKYRAKADRAAAKSGRLAIVNGAIVGRPLAEVTPPSPEGDRAVENLRGFDPDEAARRASRRAASAVRAALASDQRPIAAATTPATGAMPQAGHGSELPSTPWVVGKLVATSLPPRPVARPDGDHPVRLTSGPGGVPMPVAEPVVEPADSRPVDDQGRDRKRPTEQDKRRVARMWIGRALKGEVMSKRELADRSQFSETWCLERIREAREQLTSEGWTFDDDGRPVRPVAAAVANGAPSDHACDLPMTTLGGA